MIAEEHMELLKQPGHYMNALYNRLNGGPSLVTLVREMSVEDFMDSYRIIIRSPKGLQQYKVARSISLNAARFFPALFDFFRGNTVAEIAPVDTTLLVNTKESNG